MADRDNAGRFQPGHNQPGPGRPKRETEAAILTAITDALSPEEITEAIKEALRLAKEQKSARGIVAVIELAAAYGIGKPLQRVERGNTNAITEAMARWREMQAEHETQEIERMMQGGK